jgi:predicted metal-binding membrane protein
MNGGADTMNTVPDRARDYWLAGGALLLVVALCWAWVIPMAVDMYGSMTGASAWMMTTQWDWTHVVLLFAMWSAMMVAMMVPSATPMIVQCAKSMAEETSAARPLFGIGAFAAGYVFVWTLFSAAATIAQRVLSEAELLTPMMEPAMPAVASGLLLAAGVYQLLPFKRRYLSSCRSVSACVTRPPKAVCDAFRMGTRHGLSCLGCCGVLMLLLFAGGVMNLLVIAALTLIVIIEKVAPFGMRSTRVSGGLLIGLGIWTIARGAGAQ